MAGKTLSDRMLEVEKLAAALNQAVDLFRFERGDVAALRERLSSLEGEATHLKDQQKDLPNLKDRLAKVESELDQLKKQKAEKRGKTWSITLAIISTAIGCLFTILVQLRARYLSAR